MSETSPYATALALGRPRPSYIKNTEDADRVTAYWTYDDIYNNIAEAFAALLRADDDPKSRRYIPFGRALVEATNRYLAKDLTWTASVPATSPTVNPEVIVEVMDWLDAQFKREEFNSKFMESKRVMLRRGDALLQISADPSKAEGTRLRITQLDAAQYFPISDAVDAERTVGAYVITLLTSADAQTTVARREEYWRVLNQEQAAALSTPIGQVFYRVTYWEQDGWDDRFPLTVADLKPAPSPDWIVETPVAALAAVGYPLPAQIQAIPLYHFQNTRTDRFGYSMLQGIETILAGITQNMSDEDMTVALTGLGVYWTDSGSPRDAQGNETEWVIAPASVMELSAGKKFGRVDGVTTIQPMLDHVHELGSLAQQTSGTPDIAVGEVDVQVAQSGIALAIKMAPVIAGNKEREVGLKGTLDQFMNDLLNGWAPAYEGRQATGVVVSAAFGDALPLDREAVIAEMKTLVEAQVIDPEYARQYLSEKLGFQFPEDLGTRMAAAQTAALDAGAARLAADANVGQEGAL